MLAQSPASDNNNADHNASGPRFKFNFHEGFDLYIASRCGNKEAFEELKALQDSDLLYLGYLAMTLTRSENSSVPKDLSQARILSKQFSMYLYDVTTQSVQSAYLADAFYLLAFCYEEGFSVFKNMATAVHYYKEASSLGHPGAAVNLSNCYDSGKGVDINKDRVFELDKVAADMGHPIGLNNLGCCYMFGKGCTINHSTKVKLWKQASDMGYPMSQANLGITYLNGEGVAKDESTAIKYFQLAAKSGLSRAHLFLSHCYYRGTGVPESAAKSEEYARLAALHGNVAAQYFLGCLLYQRQKAEAICFFKRSAEGGNSDAQYLMGTFFLSGNMSGIQRDVIQAVRMLRKASLQNHTDAKEELLKVANIYKDVLWENRKSFWMFLQCYQFIRPAVDDATPCTNSIHQFFYITDLCIFLSTFI